MRWGSGAVAALVLALAMIFGGTTPAQSIDVHGDDAGDAYLGSGGLLIPPGGAPESQRRAASNCPGCQWAATVACALPDGSLPDQINAANCSVVSARCSSGMDFLLVWRKASKSAPWQRNGQVCRTTPEPMMTTDTMARYLHDSFLTSLPPPQVSHQPTANAVINLPVIWADTGRNTPIVVTHELAGHQVQLTARPVWRWDFGDGGQLRTTQPGGVWPDLSVSHTYRRPGTYTYRAEVSWPAQYQIVGLGTYPVAEVVRTNAVGTVSVQQARAKLTHRE